MELNKKFFWQKKWMFLKEPKSGLLMFWIFWGNLAWCSSVRRSSAPDVTLDLLRLWAHLAALPTNPPECSHTVWSRNCWEGCSDMPHDIIAQFVCCNSTWLPFWWDHCYCKAVDGLCAWKIPIGWWCVCVRINWRTPVRWVHIAGKQNLLGVLTCFLSVVFFSFQTNFVQQTAT